MFDVVVVGAGFAGLSCARELHSQGYSVAIFEKSRGLGGRAATRRVEKHCFNYGARYFSVAGASTKALLDELNDQSNPETPELVRWPQVRVTIENDGAWTARSVSEGYIPRTGMTAIAKYLARDIPVTRQHRVKALHPTRDRTWEIFVESKSEPVAKARAVVLAIPAPQAQTLISPLKDRGLPDEFLAAIQSVEFDACFTVITGYSSEAVIAQSTAMMQGDELRFARDSEIQWVGLVRSPRALQNKHHKVTARTSTDNSGQSLIVVTQSSSHFAEQHLDIDDRASVGQKLLSLLSDRLQTPLISEPDWIQAHLWRYAICRQSIKSSFLLTETPGMIGCAGDWCGGNQIDHAISSGSSLSKALCQRLD